MTTATSNDQHGFAVRAARAAFMLLSAVVAFASVLSAQTTTWSKTPPDGFWSQGTNWSNGEPTSTSNVVIGSLEQSSPPSVTLDVNSTISSLNVAGNGTQLTLTGDSVMNQSAAVNLTVSNTTIIGSGSSAINIGGGASLTLNGATSNGGTINLASTAIIAGEAPILSQLNGTGTITNAGTIQGNGIVSINIANMTSGAMSGNLTLNGNTVSGGGYVKGNVFANNVTMNNVTLGGTPAAFAPTINTVTLLGGSAITVQNGITNVGTLQLANAGGPVTITGPGLINNRGFISGSGTISTVIDNGMGVIQATGGAAALTLKGNVLGDGSPSLITIAANSKLVLDGAQVEGNTLRGSGGTLTATNGASFESGVIDGGAAGLTLTGGSALNASAVTLKGTVQLGDASGGANLSGTSMQMTEGAILHGGGTISAAIDGNGGLGSIVADNSAAALVLGGNVTQVKSVSATSGATLTLAGVNVSTSAATIGAGSSLNGNGTLQVFGATGLINSGTIAPSGPSGGGFLTINGYYTQNPGAAMDFALGSNSSQVLVLNNVTSGAIANFDPNSVFVASLLAGFDPSTGCSAVFGVCESFTVFQTDGALGNDTFSGFNNIDFNLPTLPAGFQWLTLDENNDAIVLEIEGMKATSGGGNGTVPEPSEWMMLAAGLIALAALRSRARRLRVA
jgi:fibronectin-binding autotransporter adhesin